MKSIRSISIVVLLLITSIAPTRADWFQDNRVPVTAALAVTAVAGCVGLGVKLYFDWKKRSEKKLYEVAMGALEASILEDNIQTILMGIDKTYFTGSLL